MMTPFRHVFSFALLTSTIFGFFAGCEDPLAYDPSEELRLAGSVCAFDWQCASRRCTAPVEGCGICVDIQALGESCAGPLLGCSRSATCTDGVCKSSKKLLGETCALEVKGDPMECDDELYCARGVSDAEGICTPRGVLGGACDTIVGCAHGADCEHGVCVVARLGHEDDSCDERRCATGLFCSYEGCRRETLPVGADCGGDLIGNESCAAGGACRLSGEPAVNGKYPLVCEAWRHEGDECATSQCDNGLYCGQLGGTGDFVCIRQGVVGQTCTWQNNCAKGLECRGDTCAEACR